MVSKKDRDRLSKVLQTGRDYDDLYFGAQGIPSVEKLMRKRDFSARYAERRGISQFDRLFSYLTNIVWGGK